MLIEFKIEVANIDIAYKISDTLFNDYNIDLFNISFPSKECFDDTEKLYLVIGEKELFLDIINAIKNVFFEHNVQIHNVNTKFTHDLIKMLITEGDLTNFFNTVDLITFKESDIIKLVENSMSIDDILDRISMSKHVSIRDKELITQIKN